MAIVEGETLVEIIIIIIIVYLLYLIVYKEVLAPPIILQIAQRHKALCYREIVGKADPLRIAQLVERGIVAQ
jgi:hypothetical protein